ncbi:MAG: flagellar filament capping protein FliD [Tissierellaceae bacterium]
MSDISFIGSYSGVDQAMIDKLMQAERKPLVQMSNKKTSLLEKQNAWKDINTRLDSLFEKIKVLQKPETFTSRKAKSTNEDIVTMSPSKDAANGTYKINIKQLATSTTIIGKKVLPEDKSISDDLGFNGSFTIVNKDEVEANIEVKAEDSLKDIVDKINAKTKDWKDENDETVKGTGISATIIDGRIVLTDEKTGARDIQLSGDIVGDLGLDTGKEIGQKAEFTINGVEVQKDSNTVSDVIEGVTINLNKVHKDDEYDTVTVSLDTEKASKAVKDFVDQYNSTMKFIEEKLDAGDPEKEVSAGTLCGDGSLMRLHSNLRMMVTDRIGNGDTNIRDISQLGVTTKDRFGELQLDTGKLNKALSEDPQNVMNFFMSKTEDGKEIGFVPRINEYVDSFISTKNGIIKEKNESYDKALKDLNRQIENFNARMERKEKYYIKMFTALDIAMMKSEDQMSWLQNQVDSMNSIKRK